VIYSIKLLLTNAMPITVQVIDVIKNIN